MICAYDAVVLLLDIIPATEFYVHFVSLFISEILVINVFIFSLSSNEVSCIL